MDKSPGVVYPADATPDVDDSEPIADSEAIGDSTFEGGAGVMDTRFPNIKRKAATARDVLKGLNPFSSTVLSTHFREARTKYQKFAETSGGRLKTGTEADTAVQSIFDHVKDKIKDLLMSEKALDETYLDLAAMLARTGPKGDEYVAKKKAFEMEHADYHKSFRSNVIWINSAQAWIYKLRGGQFDPTPNAMRGAMFEAPKPVGDLQELTTGVIPATPQAGGAEDDDDAAEIFGDDFYPANVSIDGDAEYIREEMVGGGISDIIGGDDTPLQRLRQFVKDQLPIASKTLGENRIAELEDLEAAVVGDEKDELEADTKFKRYIGALKKFYGMYGFEAKVTFPDSLLQGGEYTEEDDYLADEPVAGGGIIRDMIRSTRDGIKKIAPIKKFYGRNKSWDNSTGRENTPHSFIRPNMRHDRIRLIDDRAYSKWSPPFPERTYDFTGVDPKNPEESKAKIVFAALHKEKTELMLAFAKGMSQYDESRKTGFYDRPAENGRPAQKMSSSEIMKELTNTLNDKNELFGSGWNRMCRINDEVEYLEILGGRKAPSDMFQPQASRYLEEIANFQKKLREGGVVKTVNLRRMRKDGTPILDENGKQAVKVETRDILEGYQSIIGTWSRNERTGLNKLSGGFIYTDFEADAIQVIMNAFVECFNGVQRARVVGFCAGKPAVWSPIWPPSWASSWKFSCPWSETPVGFIKCICPNGCKIPWPPFPSLPNLCPKWCCPEKNCDCDAMWEAINKLELELWPAGDHLSGPNVDAFLQKNGRAAGTLIRPTPSAMAGIPNNRLLTVGPGGPTQAFNNWNQQYPNSPVAPYPPQAGYTGAIGNLPYRPTSPSGPIYATSPPVVPSAPPLTSSQPLGSSGATIPFESNPLPGDSQTFDPSAVYKNGSPVSGYAPSSIASIPAPAPAVVPAAPAPVYPGAATAPARMQNVDPSDLQRSVNNLLPADGPQYGGAPKGSMTATSLALGATILAMAFLGAA